MEATLAAMLVLCNGSPTCAHHARALAPIIHAEAQDTNPLLLVALAFAESSFRTNVVGKRGELGPFQVAPTGWARTLCRSLTLTHPRTNTRCAIRLLRQGRRCGGVAETLQWYGTGHCGPPGPYARKILTKIQAIN